MALFSGTRRRASRSLAQLTWSGDLLPDQACLWSKGISQYCDNRGPDGYWLADTESCQSEAFFREFYSGASGLVWVRLSTKAKDGAACDLDHFVRGALPTIREHFALITTDGDSSVPSDLSKDTVERLLGCPWLVSWHTQNLEGQPHAKLAPIPIGIDLHTPRPWSSPRQLIAKLSRTRARRAPLDRLPLRVFCDLNVSLSPARQEAVTALRSCSHVDLLRRRLGQAAIWQRYAQYPFVVSAPGYGLDCHRTWELLYLGCIVITHGTPLDRRLYEGLPVVVVSDWKEVCDRTNLEKWLHQYGPLTDRELIWKRLEPDAYLKPIRAKIKEANEAVDPLGCGRGDAR